MYQQPSFAEQKRNELYIDLIDHASSLLKDYGLECAAATHTATALANHLATHWGGSTICFPKDVAYNLAQRDLDIYKKFDGRNHFQLAREFNLTENAIYRIVKQVREMTVKQQQPDMFD